jgi:hypothetical protein
MEIGMEYSHYYIANNSDIKIAQNRRENKQASQCGRGTHTNKFF